MCSKMIAKTQTKMVNDNLWKVWHWKGVGQWWGRGGAIALCESLLCSVAQLCLTLCDPMDCSPPGSSVHGIFQARILEWVAVSFSRMLIGFNLRR